MNAQSTPDVTDGVETPNGGSLHPVVGTLPEYIQKHLDDINARDKQIGFEADPLVSEHMAWRRWAKTWTDEELSAYLIKLRGWIYTAADCEGGIILEECAFRVKRPNDSSSATRPR